MTTKQRKAKSLIKTLKLLISDLEDFLELESSGLRQCRLCGKSSKKMYCEVCKTKQLEYTIRYGLKKLSKI